MEKVQDHEVQNQVNLKAETREVNVKMTELKTMKELPEHVIVDYLGAEGGNRQDNKYCVDKKELKKEAINWGKRLKKT